MKIFLAVLALLNFSQLQALCADSLLQLRVKADTRLVVNEADIRDAMEAFVAQRDVESLHGLLIERKGGIGFLATKILSEVRPEEARSVIKVILDSEPFWAVPDEAKYSHRTALYIVERQQIITSILSGLIGRKLSLEDLHDSGARAKAKRDL